MIAGDFNEIIHHREHSNLAVDSFTSPMTEFGHCLHQLGVFDLRYSGPLYTWTNSCPSSPIAKKLDRLLVNSLFIASFPNAFASFLPPLPSDHSPCLSNLAFQLPTAGTQPFRFLNYLTKHLTFHQVVSLAWAEAGSTAANLTNLCWKLKSIKKDLRALNKQNYSNIQKRVLETNSLLQLAQVDSLQNPSQQTFQTERDLHAKWSFLRVIEECYFRQKSRINWLAEGDLNTTYFFRICQTRASYNAIRSFILISGIVITDPLEMSAHAVNHFQSILGQRASPVNYLHSPVEWFCSLTSFRCQSALSQKMTSVPTTEDVRKLFFKLNANKTPGPDGLTSGFYKASWDIVGEEVSASIIHFFTNCFLPASTNSTILALVPKFPGASKITDFRPISLLNTLYKVISRLLVVRLKPILVDLIVPNQTAFVKDRLLVENTTLAAELVNGYHRNKGVKKITIKVDISKAFDTLSWDFLLNCLQAIELPQPLLTWLWTCICTPSYMVGYNGCVSGYFKGKRGLRQGDPLSPYLFVIAMNFLSLMLNKEAAVGSFNYHHQCVKTKLTHLCFADDLLIFLDGSLTSLQRVLQVLKEFELRSGLAVSMQKSCFFSSGLSVQEVEAIQVSTGMPSGTLPIRYLGVPLCTKKLTLQNCEPLIHQVKRRFTSWSAKTLSFAGRLMLIKTVVAGITTFWSAAFILPKACISRINSLCGCFLWKGNLESHHSARVAWSEVTKTKEEGGLGIRDLKRWNKASCMKFIWLLFFRHGSLWVAWFKREILKDDISNFWTVKPNQSMSWMARKLLKMRNTIFPWITVRVGNGLNTRFWSDNWTPFGDLANYLSATKTSHLGIPWKASLASRYVDGAWNFPPARSENQVNLATYLTTLELQDQEDEYEWRVGNNSSGNYSTRLVYEELMGSLPKKDWFTAVWIKRGIPRQSFLTWLFVLNRCPTRDRLISWGLQTPPNCLLCNSGMESRDHLLFNCSYSFAVWKEAAARCSYAATSDWNLTLSHMQNLPPRRHSTQLLLWSWQASIYHLWTERNSRLHRNSFRSQDSVINQIDLQIRNKISSLRSAQPILSSTLLQLWFSTA